MTQGRKKQNLFSIMIAISTSIQLRLLRLTSSLYLAIVLFLLLPSTQVIKSSMLRVIIMAGSVMGVGPTRMCPCSIVRTACGGRENREMISLLVGKYDEAI